MNTDTPEHAEVVKDKLLRLIINDLEGVVREKWTTAPFFQYVRLCGIEGDYIDGTIAVLLAAPNAYVRDFICNEWGDALLSSVVSCLSAFYSIGPECGVVINWMLDNETADLNGWRNDY